MLYLLNTALVQVVLALTLSAPGLGGGLLLQGEQLAAVQHRYEVAMDDRAALVAKLRGLEARHGEVIEEIKRVKRQGGMGTIRGRLELEELLRQSKALADELEAVQARLRSLDNRITSQRSRLVGHIDAEIQALEQKLSAVRPSERRALVSELNDLRRRRGRYTTPLPAVPDAGQVREALAIAAEVDSGHPDELRAAADELQDTEDQLRRRIEAVEGRLDELRGAQRLVRRARSFSREERFFEEGDRNRIIARYQRSREESGGGATDSPQPTSGGGDDGAGAPAEGQNNSTSDGNYDMDGAPSPLAGGGAEGEGGLSDAPDAAPPARQPAPTDPFAPGGETVVISGSGDPSRAVGDPTGRSSGDLAREIDSLEAERRRLKGQAKRLRARARELLDRAERLE